MFLVRPECVVRMSDGPQYHVCSLLLCQTCLKNTVYVVLNYIFKLLVCLCSWDNVAYCVDNKVHHTVNGLNIKTFLTSGILFYISCGLPTVSLVKYGSWCLTKILNPSMNITKVFVKFY